MIVRNASLGKAWPRVLAPTGILRLFERRTKVRDMYKRCKNQTEIQETRVLGGTGRSRICC